MVVKNDKNLLLVILGPTASGKTSLAVALGEKLKGEIISADSRQVYCSMDIGTGKDLLEYKSVPYHLIDILPPGEHYNVARFQSDFDNALARIHENNKNAVLCGGSGMYIQAVLQNFQNTSIPKNEILRDRLKNKTIAELKQEFDGLQKSTSITESTPSSIKQLIRAIEIATFKDQHPSKIQEPSPKPPRHLIFGLDPKPSIRRERISRRLKDRIEQGLLQEVANLIRMGLSPEQLIYYGLEYKWATLYLQNLISHDEFYTKLEISIHQFAKRQMTYFRKMEKDGLKIHWLNDDHSQEEKIDYILKIRKEHLA